MRSNAPTACEHCGDQFELRDVFVVAIGLKTPDVQGRLVVYVHANCLFVWELENSAMNRQRNYLNRCLSLPGYTKTP